MCNPPYWRLQEHRGTSGALTHSVHQSSPVVLLQAAGRVEYADLWQTQLPSAAATQGWAAKALTLSGGGG